MSKNKDFYIKYVKKICEKYYPNLIIERYGIVDTHNFDKTTNSWNQDDYCIFITIKPNLEYNRYEMEKCIKSIMGSEVIITEI
jgi:hypothetical protein